MHVSFGHSSLPVQDQAKVIWKAKRASLYSILPASLSRGLV